MRASTTTLLRAGPGPAIARRVQNSAACRLFGGVRAKMLKRRSRGIAKAATCGYLCRYVVASTGNSVVVLGSATWVALLVLVLVVVVVELAPVRASCADAKRPSSHVPGSPQGNRPERREHPRRGKSLSHSEGESRTTTRTSTILGGRLESLRTGVMLRLRPILDSPSSAPYNAL